MNLKNISIMLVLFSIFFLFSEITSITISIAIITIVFNLFIKNKKLVAIYKITTIFLSTLYLYKNYHSFLKTEFGVSLVLILAALKLFELESFDDFFNMFLILILLEGCIFIVNPSVLVFVFGVLKIVFYFYFLVKLSQARLSAVNLKRLLILLIPAVIFSSLLYLTFPRFTQGFAAFTNSPIFNDASNSNINFSQLGPVILSEKKIFRAFNLPKEQININQLYWKNNVLWDFRKLTWRSGNLSLKTKLIENPTVLFSYNIKTENLYFDYLPLLDLPSQAQIPNKSIVKYLDSTLKIRPPSKGTFNVDVTVLDNNYFLINESLKNKSLDLIPPLQTNFRKLIFNNQNIQNLNLRERFNSVLTYFNSKKYEYSLTPPTYTSLEDFLINGKLGYCTHFASSFAYLLRVANIPANVVLGYQGGEVNPFDNSILVRERDSHAWIEFLDENNNWKRFDPTTLVAPERIALGSNLFYEKLLSPNLNVFSKTYSFLFKNHFFGTLDNLTSYVESNLFSRFFNIDYNDQKNLLKGFIGPTFVVTLILFILLLFIIFSYSRKNKLSPQEKSYLHFLKQMEKHGILKLPHETASEFYYRCLKQNAEECSKYKDDLDKYLSHIYREV